MPGPRAHFALETIMGLSHQWPAMAAVALALMAPLVAPLANAATTPGTWVPVASAADARGDYARGFGDAVNRRDVRERNDDYRAGYRAGRAKRESNEARVDGRDYARGYTDGFNQYRERKAAPAGNSVYAAGYRAGQVDHTNLAVAPASAKPAAPVAAATSVETLVGRPSSRLDDDMKQLGFAREGQFKKGKNSYTTWQNKGQARCVRVLSSDGKVREITDLEKEQCG
jgi:hypothetical protein